MNTQQKIEIMLGSLIAILVVASLIVWIALAGTIFYEEILSIAVVGLLVAFAAYVIWDRARNTSRGLPAKDERLVNISHKAGYYGFIAAIWTAVLASPIADILFGRELEGHLVTAAVVIVAALVFAFSYLYMAWKGN